MTELAGERSKASFNPRELTYILDGGREHTERREFLESHIVNDPVFRREPHLNRTELFKRVHEISKHLIWKIKELNASDSDIWTLYYAVDQELPITLHLGMFRKTLRTQGSPEQVEKWAKLADDFKIIGCYAQTELGHGSNVRGLETTAHYDKATQEWVLNTPTLTSYKWWPGGLGKTATHGVVFARLITPDGVDHGVFPFIVQLRSLEDHTLLKGITTGDIGPKWAYTGVDNGYLKLDNVRIPRDQLLMRWVKVDADGTFRRPPHDKLAYGTMIFVRAGIVVESASVLKRAVTIAIRYSAVRRQFGQQPDGKETKVLDYCMQQYRLLNMLATAYALHFTGRFMLDFYAETQKNIQAGSFDDLAELHATSAGLKAFATWISTAGVEECRMACGGQGYMIASGLPTLYARWVPACTYEGDNYVLLQQTARFLMKAMQSAMAGKPLGGTVTYLPEYLAQTDRRCAADSAAAISQPDTYLALLRHRAGRAVASAAQRLQAEIASGKSQTAAWDAAMVQLVHATRAHCYYNMALRFVNAAAAIGSSAIRTVLLRLAALFALRHIDTDAADWLEDSHITAQQLSLVRAAVDVLLSELRPDSVALVDAFGYHDHILGSALGRYDGRVYEALWESTKSEPLNAREVFDGYTEHLRPVLRGERPTVGTARL